MPSALKTKYQINSHFICKAEEQEEQEKSEDAEWQSDPPIPAAEKMTMENWKYFTEWLWNNAEKIPG